MLSGKARLAGVLGWPVSHSLSPRLHGFWLARHGIDGAYLPLPVRPEDFLEVVRALPKAGFRGANVTVPHKEAAFALCRDHGRLSERARRVGSVNTLVFAEDGVVEGDTTDGYGFLENLRQEAPDDRWTHGRAVVLGAGGAARSVIAGLLELPGITELVLANRTVERAEAVARDLGDPRIRVCTLDAAAPETERCTLLVNTTSVGLKGEQALPVALDGLDSGALVTDIVYHPLVTPFLAAARTRGNPIVDGLGMLLHQARPGFKAWFGTDPQVDAALRAHVLAQAA
ncbi:shikimate dehydrogenase [Novispirillum sp. DQ9]|uniref:shikimate dehydrogenase n=1 Tax=Novispirillum sp. DQ9 TaxID=3398612 RepID=UPI003C7D6FFE